MKVICEKPHLLLRHRYMLISTTKKDKIPGSFFVLPNGYKYHKNGDYAGLF